MMMMRAGSALASLHLLTPLRLAWGRSRPKADRSSSAAVAPRELPEILFRDAQLLEDLIK